MRSSFRLSLGLCSLIALSCSDMILYRSGEDYFPLVNGSEWKYTCGDDTSYVEVAGDSFVGGRTATVVLVDYSPDYWYREPTQARRFFCRTKNVGGFEDTLEARYGLVYMFPFVEGDSWQETFEDTIIILGTDTISYYHRLKAVVADIEDISVPAGTFGQCYRLDFTEEIHDPDVDTMRYSEWLAPGVGLVKRTTDTREEQLAEYRIGP